MKIKKIGRANARIFVFSDPQRNIEQFNLQPGLHVADIGSGSGAYSLAAARAVGPEGRVYAIEVQKDLIQKLLNEAKTQKLTNIEGVWGDVERLGGMKLADGAVHAAIAANILFQVQDKEAFSKEANRVIRKGGGLLVVDWNESYGGIGPAGENLVTKFQAKDLFESAGFEQLREIQAGAHHYGIIFKKK